VFSDNATYRDEALATLEPEIFYLSETLQKFPGLLFVKRSNKVSDIQ